MFQVNFEHLLFIGDKELLHRRRPLMYPPTNVSKLKVKHRIGMKLSFTPRQLGSG
jgi:hypothetical protein